MFDHRGAAGREGAGGKLLSPAPPGMGNWFRLGSLKLMLLWISSNVIGVGKSAVSDCLFSSPVDGGWPSFVCGRDGGNGKDGKASISE